MDIKSLPTLETDQIHIECKLPAKWNSLDGISLRMFELEKKTDKLLVKTFDCYLNKPVFNEIDRCLIERNIFRHEFINLRPGAIYKLIATSYVKGLDDKHYFSENFDEVIATSK